MPTATQSRLGIMIREIRERAGLTQEAFAKLLSLRETSVRRLEMGSSKLLSQPSFYQRLLGVPGFSESDVTKLLLSEGYASDWFAEINQREYITYAQLRSEAVDAIDKYLVNYPSANLDPHEPIQLAFSDDFSIFCGIQPDRERRYLVIYVTDYDTIRLRTVSAWMGGELLPGLEPEQQGDPSAGQGKNVSELGFDPPRGRERQKPALPEQAGKGQHVVYEKGHARYAREHLQATAPTIGKILIEAVHNPEDPLSPAAVRALGEFTQQVVKIRGISASAASKEFNVPTTTFLRWAKKEGVITILSEGIGPGSATILDRNDAQRAANIYHEAQRQGIQPKKLLERMSSAKLSVSTP